MDVVNYLAKLLIFSFGLFLIFSGFLMFFKPEKVSVIIAKAGSTYFINYAELGTRLLIGVAFLQCSLYSKFEIYFIIIGYFMIISAFVLMLVPIKKHNNFSVKAAHFLKPNYLKFIAPFSILFGVLLVYALLSGTDINF